MVNLNEKLNIILWKNWLLLSRRPRKPIICILIIIIYLFIIYLFRITIRPFKHDSPTMFTPVSPYDYPVEIFGNIIDIAWSPENPVLYNLMNETAHELSINLGKVQRNNANNRKLIKQKETTKSLTSTFSSNSSGSLPSLPRSSSLRSPKNPTTTTTTSTIPDFEGMLDEEEESDIRIFMRPFKSSTELDEFIKDPSEENMQNTLAAVIFPDEFESIEELPPHIQFTLRFPSELRTVKYDGSVRVDSWETNDIYPPFVGAHPRHIEEGDGGNTPGYIREGFIAVQCALSQVIINNQINPVVAKTLPPIYLCRYPFPPYEIDNFSEVIRFIIPIFVMLSFGHISMYIIVLMTKEKETELKELMEISGIPGWIQWTAWAMTLMSLLLIPFLVITIFLKIAPRSMPFINYTSGLLIFGFLLFYAIATLCFSFLVSVFFTKAKTASACLIFIWFLTYAPYGVLQEVIFNPNMPELLTKGSKILFCLLSNSALGFGFDEIFKRESIHMNLKWVNTYVAISENHSFSLGLAMFMLVIDSIIYILLAMYLDRVLPNKYGEGRIWYFPCLRDFWAPFKAPPKKKKAKKKKRGQAEEPPPDMSCCANIPKATIQHLSKGCDRTEEVIIEDINLEMFENKITVILGPCSSGKSAVINCLTGASKPSSGTAIVNDLDITLDIKKIRRMLGVCKQRNVLFDELTVKEHIYFFSILKGLSEKEARDEVNIYVKSFEFHFKSSTQGEYLPYEYKRKLSVAIAMCGGSKVILCDEPTFNIGGPARYLLWDLFQTEKKGRIILICSQSAAKAEVLGDRILVMVNGRAETASTLDDLKWKHDCGYQLIIIKDNDCDVNNVTQFLKKYIPYPDMQKNNSESVTYILNEDDKEKFEKMLENLDNNVSNLKIKSYTLTLLTLQDVFMKVNSDQEEPESGAHQVDENDQASDNGVVARSCSQYHALFLKRIWIASMRYLLTIMLILLPTLLVIFVAAGNKQPEFKAFEPLPIGLTNYKQPAVAINFSDFLDTENDSTSTLSTITSNKFMRQIITKEELYEIAEGYKNITKDSSSELPSGGDTKMLIGGIYTSYVELVTLQNMVSLKDTVLEEYILSRSMRNLELVSKNYIVGATFGHEDITAWFNNQPYHTVPLTLNMIHNAILKSLDEGKNCSILVINEPLPFRIRTRVANLSMFSNLNDFNGFLAAILIGTAMSIVSALFLLYYVDERATRVKLLQFICGARGVTYWFSSLIWDFLIFLISVIILIIILPAIQVTGFKVAADLMRVFLVLFCFGYAMLPMVYLMSFCFSIAPCGFLAMTCLNLLFGVKAFMFWEYFHAYHPSASWLHPYLMLYPHYCLICALKNLYLMACKQSICEDMCVGVECRDCEKYSGASYFDWDSPGIGLHFLYFLMVGTILMLIVLIIESKVFRKLSRKYKIIGNRIVDDDVQKETNKVMALPRISLPGYAVIIRDVSKIYTNKALAISKISLRVKKGECVGLLGFNGGGKSTLMNLMVGYENASGGAFWIHGMSLETNLYDVYNIIGYCPQYDGLNYYLTARETITLYCLLRGINRPSASYVADNLGEDLQFSEYLDIQINRFNYKNRRNLSTALALIGEPSVIFLDEPTTGMDLESKKLVWNVINDVKRSGRSVVICSSSMEECETLCSKFAIMVNGEIKCLGTKDKLKKKLCKGFNLFIQISRSKDSSSNTSSEGSIPKQENVQDTIPEDRDKSKNSAKSKSDASAAGTTPEDRAKSISGASAAGTTPEDRAKSISGASAAGTTPEDRAKSKESAKSTESAKSKESTKSKESNAASDPSTTQRLSVVHGPSAGPSLTSVRISPTGNEQTGKVEQETQAQDPEERVRAVKEFMAHSLPEAKLKSEQLRFLLYEIPTSKPQWGPIFAVLEKGKARVPIESYTLREMTMDDMFDSFLTKQHI